MGLLAGVSIILSSTAGCIFKCRSTKPVYIPMNKQLFNLYLSHSSESLAVLGTHSLSMFAFPNSSKHAGKNGTSSLVRSHSVNTLHKEADRSNAGTIRKARQAARVLVPRAYRRAACSIKRPWIACSRRCAAIWLPRRNVVLRGRLLSLRASNTCTSVRPFYRIVSLWLGGSY